VNACHRLAVLKNGGKRACSRKCFPVYCHRQTAFSGVLGLETRFALFSSIENYFRLARHPTTIGKRSATRERLCRVTLRIGTCRTRTTNARDAEPCCGWTQIQR
jgi:hypothetical protein